MSALSGSCSCGSGRSSGACSCGCAPSFPGSVGAGSSARVRPRFFAGQLLTEDDLQALVDYVMGHNRAHNRDVLGEGVLCGLQVACDPCRDGTITVRPGHALDCCGNDLVLSCPEELDINQMVRELRRTLRGGADCGDPCAEVSSGPADTSDDGEPGGPATDGPAADRESAVDTAPLGTPYVLCIRYHETLSDAVTPYATDDCGSLGCEPTRVREGVSFELRCATEEDAVDDLPTRAEACLGTPAALSRADTVRVFAETSTRLERAQTLVLASDHYRVEATALSAYGSRVGAATSELVSSIEQLSSAELATADLAREALTATLKSAAFVANWNFHTSDELSELREIAPEEYSATAEFLSSSTTQLFLARSVLSRVLGFIVSDDTSERSASSAPVQLPFVETQWARAVLQQTNTWAGSVRPNFVETSPSSFGPPAAEEYRASTAAAMLSKGAVYTESLHATYVTHTASLRGQIQVEAETTPLQHDCALVADVSSTPAMTAATGEVGVAHVRSYVTVAKALTSQEVRLRRACLCAAVLPDCLACDDPCVDLALIRVHECRVTEVCNLRRTFILSPRNLAYWNPDRFWTNLQRDWARLGCCSDDEPEDEREFVAVRPAREAAYAEELLSIRRYDYADPAPLRAASEPARLAYATAKSLARASTVLRRGSTALTVARPVMTNKGAELIGLIAQPGVRAEFAKVLDERLDAAIGTGELDLAPALSRAASENLQKVRAERSTAISSALRQWAGADSGLKAAVEPLVAGVVAAETAGLDRRVDESIARVVRNNGLDRASMDQRVGSSVSARLAAEGLNREALGTRIEGSIQTALASGGLGGSALDRRISDAFESKAETLGLGPDALGRRVSRSVDSALAAEGLSEAALSERIDGRVRTAVAAAGVSGSAFEERVRLVAGELLEGDSFASRVRSLAREVSAGSAGSTDDIDARIRSVVDAEVEHRVATALDARLAAAMENALAGLTRELSQLKGRTTKLTTRIKTLEGGE